MTKKIFGTDIEGAYKKYQKKSKNNLELKVTGSVVVPTQTKEEILLLMIYCNKVGFVFGSKPPDAYAMWNTYKQDTCFNLDMTENGTQKLIHFGEVSWYKENHSDKEIIPISDYFKRNNVTKKQLEQFKGDYISK